MKEITYEELRSLPKDSYQLIDIRDEGLVAYGMIPGAINIYLEDLEGSRELAEIPKEKKLIINCEIGRMSREIDDREKMLQGKPAYVQLCAIDRMIRVIELEKETLSNL